jgi:hypothetical protein
MIRLRKSVYLCLIEALRRRTRFFRSFPEGSEITQQWTGLGTPSSYRCAVTDGYMAHHTTASTAKGVTTWWKLTPKGALVVAYWIGCGYDYKRIESDDLPPREIPTCILD